MVSALSRTMLTQSVLGANSGRLVGADFVPPAGSGNRRLDQNSHTYARKAEASPESCMSTGKHNFPYALRDFFNSNLDLPNLEELFPRLKTHET